MIWAIVVLALVVAAWAITRFHLRGPDLSRWDTPREPPVVDRDAPSPQHDQVLERLATFAQTFRTTPRRRQLEAVRRQMDALGDDVDLTGITIEPADADGVHGEWVLAAGSDPDRRLLYLHGGAFTMGSPKSHRLITTRLARIADASVLAIDYRLMPEHHRLASLEDARTAYRWLTAHGPRGAAAPSALMVGGDSAGGTLALTLLAWIRDTGQRPPDAAIALSPGTDATLTSPSLDANVESDPMLGPLFGRLTKLPRWVLLWYAWIANRVRPADPRLSPVHDDLSGLPPLLIQASEAEMLVDDARRYANKARAAGSPVELQIWPHTLHVWQAFAPTLPEAEEAFERIEAFLGRHAPRTGAGARGESVSPDASREASPGA